MHYTLMHLSDLHAGWHFDLHIAEQLVQQAHAIQPDLLVLSGDFVLRADLIAQWWTISAYLKMLPQPQLVVPGNHDVSLFNGFYRLLFPLKRYTRFLSPTLNPVHTRPGLAVVGGCSAHGLTVDGGRLYPNQVRALDQALGQAEPDAVKVLVLHHHLADPPGEKPRRKIANVRHALRLLEDHHVDLYLCGHTHTSFVGTTTGLFANTRHNTIISQCGTSTSRRGRGTDRGKNSFHLLHIEDDVIRIIPHFYQPDEGRFAPAHEHIFPRLAPHL